MLSYIPKISKLTNKNKEKIAFCMIKESHKRGTVIMEQKVYYDYLFFIKEGELVIEYNLGTRGPTHIVKLCTGNCFGEECALLKKPSFHKIVCSSESVTIYKVKRSDIESCFPLETTIALRVNFKAKE